MGKHLESVNLSETLTLSTCTDGFWLYDETRGMNLAMRASSPQEAFVEALTYYQERLSKLEGEYKTLNHKVQEFVSQFSDDEDQ